MSVRFIPSGRGKVQCPSDPDYPEGRIFEADLPRHTPRCRFDLPYPAPECGMWDVRCEKCGLRVMVSAAGRADDPKSIVMPCDLDTDPEAGRFESEFSRRKREYRENRHDGGDQCEPSAA